MTTEQTAQDADTDETGIGKEAISSLAAALEAKDDIGEEEKSDEKTGEEDSKAKEDGEKDSKAASETEEEKEKEDAEDEDKTGEETVFSQADEVSELRGLLREQKREISLLKAKQTRVDKRTSKVIDEETGEEKDIDEELSPIETKIEARNELSTQRGAGLEIMLEQMSDTKKWGDVKEVVTEGRVEEIIDVISSHITKEQGGELEENRLDVELSIWSIANPYKYLYDLLKKNHPDFNTEEKKEEKKETETDSTEKKKEPAKANDSIGNLKGSGDKSGWTAAKIDAMDEMDLRDVPKEVYDSYLRGELK